MKVGDLVLAKLPHAQGRSKGVPCLLVDRGDAITSEAGDVWWLVIYDGELTEIHQDYFREVISEIR
jgi:hypothetical protein